MFKFLSIYYTNYNMATSIITPRLLQTIRCYYVSQISLVRAGKKNILKNASMTVYDTLPVSPLKTNSSVVNLNNDCFTLKEHIIKKLNFTSADHATPFFQLPVKSLYHIHKVTVDDNSNGYFTELQASFDILYPTNGINFYGKYHCHTCPPSLLSKYISKRIFVYTLSFTWLENSITVLLDMGVTSDRIIRDLWVLKYNSDTIRERLERVKKIGIDNLYPWMVRCSEDILNRYIQISQETKRILGDNQSTLVYLANRLNIKLEDVENMCEKAPALKTIRVTKVKNFLDFLLSKGFTEEEIVNKPRILSASQKTVEQRIEKLHQLGLSEINLNILCRSRKYFKKYCDSFACDSVK